MSLNENRNISAVSPTSEMSSLEIALQDQGTPMSLPQRPAAIWVPSMGGDRDHVSPRIGAGTYNWNPVAGASGISKCYNYFLGVTASGTVFHVVKVASRDASAALRRAT